MSIEWIFVGLCIFVGLVFIWGQFFSGIGLDLFDDDGSGWGSSLLPPERERTPEDVMRDARAASRAMDEDARRTAEAMYRAAQEARRLDR